MKEILKRITGDVQFSPLSPEFGAMFSSESMAVYVNILLYGVIGLTLSGGVDFYTCGICSSVCDYDNCGISDYKTGDYNNQSCVGADK